MIDIGYWLFVNVIRMFELFCYLGINMLLFVFNLGCDVVVVFVMSN